MVEAARGASSRFVFGQDGNGVTCLRTGWWGPETAFTWTSGQESTLELPVRFEGAGDLYIELALDAFRWLPTHVTQLLEIEVNGVALPPDRIQSETFLGYRLAGERFAGTRLLRFRLHHPDAVSPARIGASADDRVLAFALRAITVEHIAADAPFARQARGPLPLSTGAALAGDRDSIRGVTGLPLPDLCQALESLGLNCEFGLLQRRCESEPLGLLRFAGLSFSGLMQGLADDFAALDRRDCLTCYVVQAGWDWMVRNTIYDLAYHTFRTDADIPADDLLAEQVRVLRFRRQKFLDILRTGEKLFVFNRPEDMTEAEALALSMRLRRHGPNALLYISTETGRAAGSVEALSPWLFRGAMDGVQRMGDAAELVDRDNWLSDAGMTAWISLCAHAYRLWREHRPF